MENVNFQPSGEDIERALMDLGPLLGVSIKEEAPEEPADAAALATAPVNNAGSAPTAEGKEPADSLASPGAPPPPSAALCVVCSAPLTTAEGTPKLMECLHSICEPCLKAKLDERQASSRDFLGAERVTITCPQCRLQCQPANMLDQRFVMEKVAMEQASSNGNPAGEQQCNSCDDTAPATSYCADCAEFICDKCVHAHQRLKITKEHTIKPLAAALAAAGAARAAPHMFCREHPGERLALFCETCDRLTCRDCQLQHHRDHKYQFSAEMAAQARAAIAALLAEVSYKRVLLGSAMKVIRDRQQLIADKKKALVREITQTVVKLTDAINTRGKQLVLRLNEVCDAKQRTLAEKKEALRQLAAITDHCVAFVGGALEHGSDAALLHSKPAVAAHLQRIKARRADIPNPEIPVRITLALDKLPELVRVLGSLGAIVVDGKVDGGAQGPYRPAEPALHPAHQAFLAGGAFAMRARAAPLVTSTTHPHHVPGADLNLRGLLGAAAARRPAPYAPLPPPYLYGAFGRRAPYPPPPAKWHIPQPEPPTDFRIALGRPAPRPAVTSTNPKTPSPSLQGAASLELDKVCADSVRDLMATIAKLDSNGVQVVAEPAPSPAPPVHSSTDEGRAAAGDPNEDWCAVCMDGGELMCCDKCPKVFHQYCHIPTIEKLPDETETWQCLLCVNFAELPAPGDEAPPAGGLPPRLQKLVERITLELYCQYEPSLAFREPVPADNALYHARVARPMCLDAIRAKLQPRAPARYSHPAQFVADVRLLFRNAYHYNPPESQVYKDAKRLEQFFDGALLKWLPEYAYWSGEGEPPAKRARLD